MHLDFNARLAELARELRLRYFDVNDEISGPAVDGAAPVVRDEFRPSGPDHIADSSGMRILHLRKAALSLDLADLVR